MWVLYRLCLQVVESSRGSVTFIKLFLLVVFNFLTVPIYFSSGHTELESAERKRLPLFITWWFKFSPSSVNHSYIAYSGICMHEHTKLFDTSWGIHTVTHTTPLWKRSHLQRALLDVFGWLSWIFSAGESLVWHWGGRGLESTAPQIRTGTICIENLY